MFDRLSFEFACQNLPSVAETMEGENADTVIQTRAEDRCEEVARKQYSPFDDLEISSVFFEQYVIQNVQRCATSVDIWGGDDATRNFQNFLQQDGRDVLHVVFREQEEGEQSIPSRLSFPFAAESGAVTVRRNATTISEHKHDFAQKLIGDLRLQDAEVVWFEHHNGTSAIESGQSESVLRGVLELRQQLYPTATEQPLLLVSALCGVSRTISSPFSNQCEESLVRVPLWVNKGGGHAARVQGLVGSFDILPTLIEYLAGRKEDESNRKQTTDVSPSDRDKEMSDRHRLRIGARSLMSTVEGCGDCGDRLLPLTGDGWTALRTQQYLLHYSGNGEQASESDRAEEQRRRLYLKPDDFWNVHDSIVAYEAIADEMEAAWRNDREAPERS